MKLISPLFIPLSTDSDGSATVDLVTSKIPAGLMWRVEIASGEDENNAFTSIRFGIKRGGEVKWLEEGKNCLAGTLYWMDDAFWLDSDYSLVIRFTGTTSGDNLKGAVVGAIAQK